MNFKTNSGGSVKVEVLDTNGSVMSGYSQADCVALSGDSIDQVVTWAMNSELPGGYDPISLRFIIQNASVYSFNPGEAVSIVVGPTITQQPQAQTTCLGGTASFAVQATGTGTLTYQWRKNGLNLTNGGHYADVTTPVLTISQNDANDAGSYGCLVTDTLDSTASSAATLSLGTTTFAQHPSSQSVQEGQTATFTAAATGLGTITYQWQKNSTNLTNGGHYSGATTSTLTIATADAGDAASYRCVATGGCGIAASDAAALTVTPAATACLNNGGFENGFTSGVAGGWTKFNLVGNVTCSATTTSIRSGSSAQQVYSPNSSNTGGVYQQVAVTPGQQYTFKVYVKTSNANVMEGYLGVDPAGGTNYANVPQQYLDFTSYTTWSLQTVTVTATANRVTVFLYARSTKASVDGYVYFDDATPDCSTVVPAISQQPQAQSGCPGRTVTFSVTATGAAPLAYQWQRDSANITNAGHYANTTTSALTISNADAGDVASYRCVVTNTNGSATSAGAALTLRATVAADLDQDCDVDGDDLVLFRNCDAGPMIPPVSGCQSRDFDQDGYVDQSDFGIFQRCYTGVDGIIDPDCGN